MWINVKQVNGEWFNSGKPFDRFSSDWAEGQPSGNGQCAIVSAAEGYKMVTSDCSAQHASFCMMQRPNCPQGYTWLPLFGSGTSCFKLVPGHLEYQFTGQPSSTKVRDLTVPENHCLSLMDKTRLAVIEKAVGERDVLQDWYIAQVPQLAGQV